MGSCLDWDWMLEQPDLSDQLPVTELGNQALLRGGEYDDYALTAPVFEVPSLIRQTSLGRLVCSGQKQGPRGNEK